MINKKRIRTLLRKTADKFISVRSMMPLLKWKQKETAQLLDYLEAQGYIEPSAIGQGGYWQISMRGRVLAHSVLVREFKADTINRHLDALLARAREVNESTRFPDRITCIKVISPYPVAQRSTGINIAYCLSRKDITEEAYQEAAHKLRAAYGGTFGNILDYHTYPAKAIARFLQSGSKVLKLHEYNAQDLMLLQGHIVLDTLARQQQCVINPAFIYTSKCNISNRSSYVWKILIKPDW